ncbi:hypothetical protein H632_c955p0 [Helicosporidium sp. ATCC 50920]|nr:hypothetical protein H632_c955p0 [Helicosporidium sp. ATCC 50920]|eukprot:KDD74970.1 hypothetical protein H632_c955p0 [Helicosporidium sp. ATCC 50920]
MGPPLSAGTRAQKRDVLGLLWRRVFYQPTNEFRAFAEQDHLHCHTQITTAFVLFLADGHAWYAALAQEFHSRTPTEPDDLAGSLIRAHHAAELHCLIASADLQRYAVPLLPETERKGAASSVRRQYLTAVCRDPRHGSLCNRLGVVEQERGDCVAAAWWFCR